MAPGITVMPLSRHTFTASGETLVVLADAPGLVPAELGDNSQLEPGEWVLAMGNPLGFSNTVSVGESTYTAPALQSGSGGGFQIVTLDGGRTLIDPVAHSAH